MFDVRHDHLITENSLVSRSISRGSLGKLPSLAGLNKDEIASYIISNLAAEPIKMASSYQISYRSADLRDAATILQCIIDTYENYLSVQYHDPPDAHELLHRMPQQITKDRKILTKRIDQLEKQIAAGKLNEYAENELAILREEIALSEQLKSITKKYLEIESAGPPEEDYGPLANLHPGFDFKVLIPPTTGVSISPSKIACQLIGSLLGSVVEIALAVPVSLLLRRQ